MDIPQHLGIIMDGNRRWARERGFPSFEGHRAGYELMKQVGRWCLDRGVKVLTVYAFSIENWKRTKEEVGHLMDLFFQAVTKDLEFFEKDDIRLKIIGRKTDLSSSLKQAITLAEKKTANNKRGLMQIAISYGGRDEIVRAAQKACLAGEITEETIDANLDTVGVPDVDLVIRTSGEQRLSGFLTWETVYSELYFLNKHWPDFSEADLDQAIRWYQARDRRRGK